VSETTPVSGTLIDLDAYRTQRIAENTWPPDELTVREYWKGRRPKGKKPEYKKPSPDGGAA
jgi:hypothetical protein